MSKLKVAIIGAGHLGRIHARLAKGNEQLEVVGVVEPAAAARTTVASELELPTFEDYRSLIGQMEAAIIATPTIYHYDVASELLRAGVHVLVEKPLASTPDQADRLVQIARRHDLVLQVGHVERFNPSWTAVQAHLGAPKYIDCVRAGAYSGRSTDIGVVHDLMIHDIDLVLSLVRSPVTSVSACGLSLLGQREDLAEARVTFANGCIANFKASRVSLEATRRMSVFTTTSMAEIDFSKNEVRLVKPSVDILDREVHLDDLSAEQRAVAKGNIFGELFKVETLPAEPRNAILDEQNDFALSIRTHAAPMVTGEDGTNALKLAGLILDQIATHGWEGEQSRPWQIGPGAATHPKILPLPQPGERKGPSRRAG
ncbi:MAG: Gfo/Idh/MocA family oxidoreductase [Pirellulaceae bacterium]|nr:Gfo/Idh/MocA family oxidoreductase [Pirellulaceae bacterium]